MPKKKKEEEFTEEVVTSEEAEKKPSKNGKSRAIEVAMQALKKKFGEEVVNWVSDIQQSDQEVISTTSLSLDAALGVGGIVRGRIYEFYGKNASGKTTLALLVIKEAIKRGFKAFIVDAEHTLDKKLLVSMGIDPAAVAIVRGYTGEENLDLAESLMATGEFAVGVIDSISALQPSAEANLESFSDNTMGLHPRLMSRMCRTFTALASRTQTALILINQIRANIGGYGNPETTSGGNAIQHHVSGRIRVTGGGTKSRQIKDASGNVIGHRVGFEITKNKLAVPFRIAEVDLIYGKGFDQPGEIFDLGREMGFIDSAGAWFSVGEDKIGQGRENSIAAINKDSALKGKLLSDICKVLGVEPAKIANE